MISLLGAVVSSGCLSGAGRESNDIGVENLTDCEAGEAWSPFQGGPRHRGRTTTTVGSPPTVSVTASEAFPSGRTGFVVCDEKHVFVAWENTDVVHRYHTETGVIDALSLGDRIRVYPELHCSTLVARTTSSTNWIDTEAWTQIEQHSSAGPFASPLVVGGRLYLARAPGIRAYTPADGELWSHTLDRVVTGVAGTADTVYVVSSNADGGRLVALDAESGAVRWETDRLGETYTDPVVGTNLYVSNAAGELFALDRTTGALEWTARAASRSGLAPMAVDGDELFVLDTAPAVVRGLRAADGQTRWETRVRGSSNRDTSSRDTSNRDTSSRDTPSRGSPSDDESPSSRGSPTLFPPVVTPQRVVLGGGGGLRAFSRSDGTRAWAETGHVVTSPMGVTDDRLYALSPSGIIAVE